MPPKKKLPRKKSPSVLARKSLDNPHEAFTEVQKFHIIQWLGEGLTTREMNARAAVMKPPFMLSASEVYYYRQTRKVDIETARWIRESEIMNSGFALRERRVEALNSLSMKIFEELNAEKGSKLWLKVVKGIGSGPDFERVEFDEFNRAEIETLRNLLDDIALEAGGRVRRTDITTKDKPIQGTGLDLSLWKELSDEELAILERAAEILERSSNSSTASEE